MLLLLLFEDRIKQMDKLSPLLISSETDMLLTLNLNGQLKRTKAQGERI